MRDGRGEMQSSMYLQAVVTGVMELLLSYWRPRRGNEVLSRRFSGRDWLFAAFLSWSTIATAADTEAPAETNVQAVTRTVIGILGYTRWPHENEELRLCTVGTTDYAAGLLQSSGQLIAGRRLIVKQVDVEQLKASECDGIYVGDMNERQWRKLMLQESDRPLLTISERSSLCRIGAMFCLSHQGEGPGFEINLDSIARSGLRVSPKVLQLARSKAVP